MIGALTAYEAMGPWLLGLAIVLAWVLVAVGGWMSLGEVEDQDDVADDVPVAAADPWTGEL